MDVALLHDLIAFRVLTPTKDECYAALGVIHRLWHPHDDRIRDYIATPKVNGYRSLHTAVFALDGRLAQIHIRTHEMHRAAQHGVATFWIERAAHGRAVDARQPIKSEDMPDWVSQLATWHHELGLSAADFVATLRGDLLEEQIFVFTPKGDIRELPAGSTVLDLAYAIHTKIGDHASSAWVQTNSPQGVLVTREVPVDYVLRSGDVVRIMADPAAHPTDEWRDVARTRYAREKIARTLRILRRAGELGDTDDEPATLDGELVPLRHPSGKLAHVELARCCYPCPGDAIVGIAQRGRTVTIHRACCRILRAAIEHRRAHGRKHAEPLHVSWPEIQPIIYRAHLSFVGQDHEGLMHELSNCAARLNLNVSASRADSNQSRYKAAVTLTLDIPPSIRLDTVLRRFQAVPGIVSATRDTAKGCGTLER
jgi:(p)ppGpp synthase/HD superfamily hydrolase